MTDSSDRQTLQPYRVWMTEEEQHQLQLFLREVASQYNSAEEPEFLDIAPVLAHEVPRRLRIVLNDFRLKEQPPGGLIIAGYPVNDEKIGHTPTSRNSSTINPPSLQEEMLLTIFSSLLGDPFVFASWQDGRVLDDVVPIKGHEHTQLGSSSKQPLEWHTEDAFHPFRPDYLVLLCLRNPQQAATTFASIDAVQISSKYRDLLFEARFSIRPDESYQDGINPLLKGSEHLVEDDHAISSSIEHLNKSPEKVAPLFGDRRLPYVRIDPHFMESPTDDKVARDALDALVRALDSVLVDVMLQPGDLFFIDNYKAIHGRKPFQANYDGNDRWLKRIRITKDFRKSRSLRTTSTSRIIL